MKEHREYKLKRCPFCGGEAEMKQNEFVGHREYTYNVHHVTPFPVSRLRDKQWLLRIFHPDMCL